MRRHSRKREAILNLLLSTKSHPSAEWIYSRLKPEIPDLSLSTIYRNLDEFLREGSAKTVGTYLGQQRYDGDMKPHGHFLCEECGKLLDVDGAMDVSFQKAWEEKEGCEVRAVSLLYYGRCRECSQKREQSSLLDNI